MKVSWRQDVVKRRRNVFLALGDSKKKKKQNNKHKSTLVDTSVLGFERFQFVVSKQLEHEEQNLYRMKKDTFDKLFAKLKRYCVYKLTNTRDTMRVEGRLMIFLEYVPGRFIENYRYHLKEPMEFWNNFFKIIILSLYGTAVHGENVKISYLRDKNSEG